MRVVYNVVTPVPGLCPGEVVLIDPEDPEGAVLVRRMPRAAVAHAIAVGALVRCDINVAPALGEPLPTSRRQGVHSRRQRLSR